MLQTQTSEQTKMIPTGVIVFIVVLFIVWTLFKWEDDPCFGFLIIWVFVYAVYYGGKYLIMGEI